MNPATPPFPVVRVGLHGVNGHQIHERLLDCPFARVVAVSGFPASQIPRLLANNPEVRHCQTLDELLANARVDVVSLCSPRRDQQAADAIASLRAGKHVYAEKPCATEERDLDAILETARQTGKRFREMCDTIYSQPWHGLKELVASGRLGTVVQVHAQKSYPWHDGRSADEGVDG
jgi:predicted dehydrogenase